MHPRARTTPHSRALIIQRFESGTSAPEIARMFGISRQTVYKWLRRYHHGGEAFLADRRPIAKSYPTQLSLEFRNRIERLRRTRRILSREISTVLNMPRSTVIKHLKKLGLERLSKLERPLLIQRYECAKAGELVHIDIKKLCRFEKIGPRIQGVRSHVGYRRMGYFTFTFALTTQHVWHIWKCDRAKIASKLHHFLRRRQHGSLITGFDSSA